MTTCECKTCGELVPQGTCTCGPNRELRQLVELAPKPKPRVGVEVTEPHWLAANCAGSGAAVVVERRWFCITSAWIDDGELIVGNLNDPPDLMDGAQVRALADYISDLYQCQNCDHWYKGGEICPVCDLEQAQ